MKAIFINGFCTISTLLFILFGVNHLCAQIDQDSTLFSYPSNDSVQKALVLTDHLEKQLVNFKLDPEDLDSINLFGSTWYWFNIIENSPEVEFLSEFGLKELQVYGAFSEDYQEAVTNINEGLYQPIITFMADSVGEAPTSFIIPELVEAGLYIIKAMPYRKEARIDIIPTMELEPISMNAAIENRPWNSCFECIDGDMLLPGDYLVSAWVSMDGAAAGTVSYTGPEIIITKTGGTTTVTPANSTLGTYIIDGWQLIEGIFTIPTSNSVFSIELRCESGTCYFDDVRIQPVDASMKSFVYDPFSLRLAAELDERHYATFYEYDEEGRLKRIKKETERGVMSIQETNTSNVKTREEATE